MEVQSTCSALSEAVRWAVEEIGLTDKRAETAYRAIWAVAAWQGNREFRNGKIKLAEEAAELAHREKE